MLRTSIPIPDRKNRLDAPEVDFEEITFDLPEIRFWGTSGWSTNRYRATDLRSLRAAGPFDTTSLKRSDAELRWRGPEWRRSLSVANALTYPWT